jgi:hypothetical protein
VSGRLRRLLTEAVYLVDISFYASRNISQGLANVFRHVLTPPAELPRNTGIRYLSDEVTMF